MQFLMEDLFRKFSNKISILVGTPGAFMLAFTLLIVWAITGPFLNFSDRWQLIINTATTISTFLMVFLIQNTQNRETKTMNLKLDELIRSVKTARNELIDMESMSNEELDRLEQEFLHMADKVRSSRKRKLAN